MRLSFVATPAPLPDLRPAPGSLDGDLIRARLPLPDTAFRVVDLDPGTDLAEQLEAFFDAEPADGADAVLFYASGHVVLSVEGEPFLCLDPQDTATGDSIKDLALVLRERTNGPLAFLLECRHDPDPTDPFRSATIVSAIKEAVASGTTGIELLLAAHPSIDGDGETPSPFTRALIAELDESDPEEGLTTPQLFERIHESEQLLGSVSSFTHVRGSVAFDIVPKLPPKSSSRPPLPSEDVAEADRASLDDMPTTDDRDAAERLVDPDAPTVSAPADVLDPATEEISAPPPPPREDEPPTQKLPRSDAPPKPSSEPPAAIDAHAPPSSKIESVPPRELPTNRSFLRPEPEVPRVVISEPPPPAPSPLPPPVEAAPPPKTPAPPPPATPEKAAIEPSPNDHVSAGDALAKTGDGEGALGEYKKALAKLASGSAAARAAVYVRIASVKDTQGKRREAISNLEKALGAVPTERAALAKLVELNLAEGDVKATAAAEDKLLAALVEPSERVAKLVELADRWAATDASRGRALLERAREIDGDDREVLDRLRASYEAAGALDDALAVRKRLAALVADPTTRATELFAIGRFVLEKKKDEDGALELFDQALDTDPTVLEPLAVVATILAERQEWSELEAAYRRMLERAPRIKQDEVRSQVTYELCRRLGLLYRDHLEDPSLALDALEDGLDERPSDANGHLLAVDIAKAAGKPERAAAHLQAVARIEPARLATYHELFEIFQRTRRADLAYQAACITTLAKAADARERIIFDEHKPEGVVKPARALRPEAWELLKPIDRDRYVEEIFEIITPFAIRARVAQLAADKRLPALDPAGRQDPAKTTVSVVRSFAWGSHFLGVPLPAIFLNDVASLGIAAVPAEEPTVVAGGAVLRGRSAGELAFLVGRHLAYHLGANRLLLYFPSIDDLGACFLAAVSLALPEVPIPMKQRTSALALRALIEPALGDARAALKSAVVAFEKAHSRADLTRLVADVERTATRAGFLLAGDLEVARACMTGEPRGVLDAEAKLADLFGFAVSDAHETLRAELGIAIQS